MMKFVLFLFAISRVAAFNLPSTKMSAVDTNTFSRRDLLKTSGFTALVVGVNTVLPTIASAEVEVPPQVTEYAFPTDWGLEFKYEQDAAKVREHMIIATGLGKGAVKMEDYGKNMKKEMIDFVSYYRRFPKVAGKPSFSTLYTSINVLAGHYTSYGYKYPLPEKRRKRLYQEYSEIDKSLKRNR
uniref:Photosystem II Psb27 protein n=1 Tax=Proboscia inermis TaxID=420281 RepID=A0A7S0CHV7_9STRA|mmetsp:Transcript_9014/g.10416  ORF Transcript_9014/g.10416 Transcript_9014/m.10416 type:complete len:184 (-) Transcript_9014:451-1002(-)|eukprot:CAMPEP_0171293914 /NCGR_PEP_ID=MMETSP0816-20121228/2280_1 /TAXON_ID=420281 /ORGANISM="Proboscia inermis, Strain CCAP1064/1" /LENGTH=183 /DNA_ID=CAMNT_0011765239 /DNA_START=75 /DNA_END=626 /DNA_ORIENTATION=-